MSLEHLLLHRYVIDTSSLMRPHFIARLESILQIVDFTRKDRPEYGKEEPTGPYDKPFILPPPCWWELREGIRIFEGSDNPWLENIKDTLLLLKRVQNAGLLNEEESDVQSSGSPVAERKLFWLKKLKDELMLEKKEVLFVTDNPFLLIRAAIARINVCNVEELLDYRVPKYPWQTWSFEGRSKENVLIVDERFFTTDLGSQLLSRLPAYHGIIDMTFRLFLTKEVQEFAQANQWDNISDSFYPFRKRDPKNVYFSWLPESLKPKACELPKTHRRYVNHKEAVLAVLSAPARFERECGFWCIGEPYGLETNGGIYLDQVPLSSKIYVVSNDHEWSDDICAKVEDCRPGSHPERITMEAVLTTFHWDSSSEDELAEDVSAFESAPKKMKLDSDQSMEGKIRQAPLESTTAVAPTEIVIR